MIGANFDSSFYVGGCNEIYLGEKKMCELKAKTFKQECLEIADKAQKLKDDKKELEKKIMELILEEANKGDKIFAISFKSELPFREIKNILTNLGFDSPEPCECKGIRNVSFLVNLNPSKEK